MCQAYFEKAFLFFINLLLKGRNLKMKNRALGITLIVTSATAGGIVFGLLLLLLFSTIGLSTENPLMLAVPFATVALFAGSFFAGALAAILGRREHFHFAPVGTFCGALLIIILSCFSAFSTEANGSVSFMARCFLYLGVLLLSLFGATLFREREKTHARYKVPRRRRR